MDECSYTLKSFLIYTIVSSFKYKANFSNIDKESPVKFRFLPNSFTSLEELTCIVEFFDASCFVVLVAQNGNTLVSYLFFYNVNKIYECYEARSAFSLFKMNELFSHHFPGFNLEIYDPRTYHNPIRFS